MIPYKQMMSLLEGLKHLSTQINEQLELFVPLHYGESESETKGLNL